MKAYSVILGIVAACTAFSSVWARPATHSEWDNDDADSTVAVIAWFNKRDTMTYWINESSWKVKDGDTTKTSGVSTKVMLTVTDSTKKGYNMEYKFLDFQGDTLADSKIGEFQNTLVNKLSKDIVGTSIRFRTDEYGHITKYENLKEIKTQAKKLFDSAYEELLKLPVMDSLKSVGIDITTLIKNADIATIVDGYTEELEMMFRFHGNSFTVGEYDDHSDETKKEYASDSHLSIDLDPETMEYSISTTVETNIPSKDLKELVGSIVETFSDNSKSEDFSDEYDKQVKEDAIVSSWNSWKYFADGWPSEVLSQTETMLMGQGKLKQTFIAWETRSVGNPEK